MNHEAFFEQVHDQIIAWVCEQSGLPREIVETVMGWESHFWESHPRLYAQAESEGDEGDWCSHS